MVQLPDCLSNGSCATAPDLDGFTSVCFADVAGVRHQLYVTGSSGPPVILLHEISGLTNDTLATARQLAAARYTVVVPLLFGEPGTRATFRNMRKVCGDDGFACNRCASCRTARARDGPTGRASASSACA